MKWRWRWWNKSPKPKKVYLGYTEITYASGKGADVVITQKFTLQFYAMDNDLEQRWCTWVGSDYSVQTHPYHAQRVVPWLEGGNLYTPIAKPSEWLREYTERVNGYKWIDDIWVKPAPSLEKREGNVLTLIKKDKS